MRINATMIPIVLGAGAGAAVALQGKSTADLDPAMQAQCLSMDLILHALSQSFLTSVVNYIPLASDASLSRLEEGAFKSPSRAAWLSEMVRVRDSSVLSGIMTVRERVATAIASKVHLENLVESVSCRSPPNQATIMIVGMGLAGLAFCSELVQVEPSLMVFEKTSCVGGVWRWQGNPTSRVNKCAQDSKT
jgi:hypothetical protein